jgi:hypothetical protein
MGWYRNVQRPEQLTEWYSTKMAMRYPEIDGESDIAKFALNTRKGSDSAERAFGVIEYSPDLNEVALAAYKAQRRHSLFNLAYCSLGAILAETAYTNGAINATENLEAFSEAVEDTFDVSEEYLYELLSETGDDQLDCELSEFMGDICDIYLLEAPLHFQLYQEQLFEGIDSATFSPEVTKAVMTGQLAGFTD